MERDELHRLLLAVRRGRVEPGDAARRLIESTATANLDIARIDHRRALRRGMPEVVFGQGKSQDQLRRIVDHLAGRGAGVLVTRLEPSHGEDLAERHPAGRFNALARTFAIPRKRRARSIPGFLVVSAGTSDLPVAEEAIETAVALGLEPDRLFDVGVAGLHRLLEQSERLAHARVIAVVAGMEGALPSVVAGLVDAPVIGVPTSIGYGAAAGGFTALFGMLTSCAGGMTVVNIDNGFGAACAANLILRGRSRKA